MRRLTFASFMLVMFGLMSCAGDGPLSPGERRDLNRARDTWNAHRPSEYIYEFRETCFCTPQLTVWNEVRVRGDSVVSVTRIDPLPAGFTEASLPANNWPTVPWLFNLIDATGRADGVADVSATYDPDFGYPRTIDVRCPAGYLDCGASYQARNLRAAP